MRTCYCGLTSYMKTSWTETNPGRRYYGCPKFRVGTHCKFFEWVDKDEVDARSRQIIPELRARNIRLESELRTKFANDNRLYLEPKALRALCVGLVILICILLSPTGVNQGMLPF
jgi:hypothetical protein